MKADISNRLGEETVPRNDNYWVSVRKPNPKDLNLGKFKKMLSVPVRKPKKSK